MPTKKCKSKRPTHLREAQRFLETLTGGPLTFGRLMMSVRLCEEISQAEMARRLGVSRSHLCDIEKSRKTVSPERAARFARILGYDEGDFVGLALQDLVEEAGLSFTVRLDAA